MDANTHYYRHNARSFFDATVSVDMSVLHERFLAELPAGSHILDAGCGSGRDARAFAERGFSVTAFDASRELAALASEHTGLEVAVRSFADVDEVDRYDGIWCCASLLHVPAAEMPSTLARLWRALRAGGMLYLSFKMGQGEREHGGRCFTDADPSTLERWLGLLPDLKAVELWESEDRRPDRIERWINGLAKRGPVAQHKLVTGGDDPFLPHLSQAIARANRIDIAVSFIKTSGIRLLLPDLLSAASSVDDSTLGRRQVRVLTSDYLDVTDPEALRLLTLLQAAGSEVKVYETNGLSFHLKAYIFAQVQGDELAHGTAFIGSSNISRPALQEGLEWNYRVAFPGDAGFVEARQRFEQLFAHPQVVSLSSQWIEAYEQRRVNRLVPAELLADDEPERPPEPTSVQLAALNSLARSREMGFRRGLVVLATGLGKTWLAAFDSVRCHARRILFVAHREEILSQAAQTFMRIRPHDRIGIYNGRAKEDDLDVLCASVQTLGKSAHLQRFAPDHFDYVVVDEFHHAAAATYRRLIGHFAPGFLLGLTATPDRTDQSDILSLCDDNLVYACNLFDGVQDKLLAPFHYFGILDEEVNYTEVPWRNGRFDPDQLTSKLATLGRARHVLREWQSRAQVRTLAFCISVRHAEFMAAQFKSAGIPAEAVYAGSPLGRTEALEYLRTGRISVLFSVDLFNEGVDVPGIDTVMMLRPTESKILFLQQLGRGLRLSDGKTHLVILDFIGNHRAFLRKPQALFGIGSTFKAIADFARQAEEGRLNVPDGCYVNFDLRIIDFLKSLESGGPEKDYEALREGLGRRPTLVEFHRSGASVMGLRRQHGSWFQLVDSMGDLTEEERLAQRVAGDLLRELEVTAMTKSFKMILLEAWLEVDGLVTPPTVPELAQRSWEVLHRRVNLLSDLPARIRALADGAHAQWIQYWRDNPINAWTGANRSDAGNTFFRSATRFEFVKTVPTMAVPATTNMLQELVDYRLATYEVRRSTETETAKVIPLPVKPRTAVELPYFPNLKIACGHFRAGRADSEEHRILPDSYGLLDPARHFIARASGNSMNGGKNPIRDGDLLLLELLSPSKAGSITGSVMVIERQDDSGGDNQYLLRVVTKTKDGAYVLKANNPDYTDLPATEEMRTLARLKCVVDPLDLAVGQSFAREEIPALFGESFNPGLWNVGHVVLNDKNVHVLLVTLNKQGKARDHRYLDHWIDDTTFHWQSQASTTPDAKRGQEIINHAKRRIAMHLFVRENKLVAGKAAPFQYYGQVTYQAHTGSNPMSVTFHLQRT